MALIDDFKSKFPNFDATNVDTYFPSIQDDYKCYYGGTYGNNSCDNIIILYLLGHLYYTYVNSIENGVTPPTIESSRSVGRVSVSIDTSLYKDNGDDVFFSSTVYGMQYLRLIRKNMALYYV